MCSVDIPGFDISLDRHVVIKHYIIAFVGKAQDHFGLRAAALEQRIFFVLPTVGEDDVVLVVCCEFRQVVEQHAGIRSGPVDARHLRVCDATQSCNDECKRNGDDAKICSGHDEILQI